MALHFLTSYDLQLSEISGLHFYPWIGKSYPQLPPGERLLLIAESHYEGENEGQTHQNHSSPHQVDFTRQQVEEVGLNQGKSRSQGFYRNLRKTLFSDSRIDASGFYQMVSFFTLVQRPIARQEDQETRKDFQQGIQVLLSLLPVLQPGEVWFLWNSCREEFLKTLKHAQIPYDEHERTKINGGIGLSLTAHFPFGSSKLIFTKHLSRYYSWVKWQPWVREHLGSSMERLERETL